MGILKSDTVARIIAAALSRDADAEKRDRRSEARDVRASARPTADETPQEAASAAAADAGEAAVDRVHAGQDRDLAAADRYDLVIATEAESQSLAIEGDALLTSLVGQSRSAIAKSQELMRRSNDLLWDGEQRQIDGAATDSTVSPNRNEPPTAPYAPSGRSDALVTDPRP